MRHFEHSFIICKNHLLMARSRGTTINTCHQDKCFVLGMYVYCICVPSRLTCCDIAIPPPTPHLLKSWFVGQSYPGFVHTTQK